MSRQPDALMAARAWALAFCSSLEGAYEDYPFHDPNWAVMRHRANQKTFALIFERQGHIWINVKAEPQWVDFWRSTYAAVLPAYHMNKQHWVSTVLDGSIPKKALCRLIEESHALTAPHSAKRNPRTSRPAP